MKCQRKGVSIITGAEGSVVYQKKDQLCVVVKRIKSVSEEKGSVICPFGGGRCQWSVRVKC